MTLIFGYAESRGGTRICYVTEPGTGTPVLLVLNARYPCGSVLAHYSGALTLHRGLAGGAGWHMFDWRGSGKSSAPAGSVTFPDLVHDVEAVADAAGGPLDVVAVNDACGMALAFAARRPEMVRRMLLVAPQGAHARSDESKEPFRRAFAVEPVGILAQYLMWVHPGTNPSETFRIAEEAIGATPLALQFALAAAAASVDLLEIAPSVLAPAFVIAAGNEFADAIELAAAMPSAHAANWTEIGNGTIDGAAWRRAWDETFPPTDDSRPSGAAGDRAQRFALSRRQSEVLELVCRGRSNAEIAVALVIAPSTAKRHVANIFGKLGVSSRPQAIALAHEWDLVPSPRRSHRV